MLFTLKKQFIYDSLLFLFIIAVPLIFTTITPDNQVIIRFVLLSFLLLCYSIYGYFNNTNVIVKANTISLILIIAWIIYTLFIGISLIYTVNITDGLFTFLRLVLLLCFILIIVFNNNDYRYFIDRISKYFTILSFIIIAIGIFQLIKLSIPGSISHANLYSIKSTFGHKNIYSQVMLLCLPFSIYQLFIRKKVWFIFGIVNTLTTIIFLTILMTRSVWVAAFFSFIITLIIGIVTVNKKLILKRIGLYFLIITATISLSIFVYSKFDKSSAFEKQFNKIFNFNYGSTGDRIILWEKSLELAKERPLIGHGPGSWKLNILKYGNKGLKSEDNITFYQRPHNDFIWILCEAGTIALVIYIFIFLCTVYYSIKFLKIESDIKVKFYILLMIYALFCYLLFSFFSFPSGRIEFIIFLALIFGSTISIFNKQESSNFTYLAIKIKTIFLFVIVLSFITSILGISRFYSEIHLHNAYLARANGNWKLLISEIDKSKTHIYKIDAFSTPLDWYRGLANFNLGNYKQANNDFTHAYKINPYHIHVLNNLGTCKGIEKQYREAIKLYKKALSIAPNFEDATYNLCAVYQKTNDIDSALFYLKNIKIPKQSGRYNKILLILTKQKLNALLVISQTDSVKNYIQKLLVNDELIIKFFNESIRHNNTIEEQLIFNTHTTNQNK